MEFNLKEPLTLGNLCNGDLEQDFKSLYRELIARLDEGEKGSLAITIDISKTSEATQLYTVGYKITPKYPARGTVSVVGADQSKTLLTSKISEQKLKVVTMFDDKEE